MGFPQLPHIVHISCWGFFFSDTCRVQSPREIVCDVYTQKLCTLVDYCCKVVEAEWSLCGESVCVRRLSEVNDQFCPVLSTLRPKLRKNVNMLRNVFHLSNSCRLIVD